MSSERRILTRFVSFLCLATLPFLSSCGDESPSGPPTPVATTVTISPATATLEALGATTQFSASVKDQSGLVMAGASVTWGSSNSSVATVSPSGLGLAVAVGSTTISATSGTASGSASLSVTQAVATVSVTPSSHTLISFGETHQLAAEAFDANEYPVEGVVFTWASTDESVAVIDETGLVTAVENGESTITSVADGVQGSALISVVQDVVSVELTPDSATLQSLGETVQLTAEASDANGYSVAGVVFTWASSDEAVAVIDEAGLVTAVSNGPVTLTGSNNAVSGSASLQVDQVAVGLWFTEVPGSAEAGEVLDPGVSVAGLDALGNLVTTFDEPVTVYLDQNPSEGTLLGTNQVSAVSGVATFESLYVDRHGGGYTFLATSPGLEEAISMALEITPCQPVNPAYPRTLCVIDPVGDSSGEVDLAKMVMSFDDATGAYEIQLVADPAHPFNGWFRINLNLFNPEAASFFEDVFNDYQLGNHQLLIVLEGISPALTKWTVGEHVYLHSLDGAPNPPGSLLFRSSVSSEMGFLTDEDLIAFARRSLPAIVY